MPGPILPSRTGLLAGAAVLIACAKQAPPPEAAETASAEPVVQAEPAPVAPVAPTPPPPPPAPPAPPPPPTGPLTCDSTYGADLAPSDGCVTDVIGCGETVRSHTQGGGPNRFDTAFYQSKYCFVTSETYDGGERIYRFNMPPSTHATVELSSPCADLDLMILQWSPEGCPARGSSISNCETNTRAGGGTVELDSIRNPRSFLVAVEGKGGDGGPFELTVACDRRE